MKITKRQLRRIIKEEKAKLITEQRAPLALIGGDMPIFHDAALDEALNDYVEKFVDMLESDIGESRATMALLANMKEYLVRGIKKSITDAQHAAGIRL